MKKKLITENMFHTINEKLLPLKMIFSSRRKRSISIQVKNETILMQAPLYTPRQELYNFIQKQEKWILKQLSINERRRGNSLYDTNFSAEIIKEYRIKAQDKVNERVRIWQEIVGVKPKNLKITNALKRWGSCSVDNVICFSWRVILLPGELLDYIVVHELCHIVHKNHSSRFWGLVKYVMPDYKQRDKALLAHSL